MPKRNHQRGETIVEVMAAFLLMLIFIAVFAASLRFARAMTIKAETLREQAYNRVSELYPVNNTAVNWEDSSSGISWKFTAEGTGRSFTVGEIQLQVNHKDDPNAENAADFDFYRYTK